MATFYKISLFLSVSTTIIHFIFSSSAQTDNYIVHMDLASMPKAFSTHHYWYLSIIASALDAAKIGQHNIQDTISISSSKLVYTYTHVINGFAATLTNSELEALKASPGYLYSTKDLPVKPDTTHSTKFLGLDTNSRAWEGSNYGDGIIVGVADTGVWPESESYADHGIGEAPKKWKGECENGTLFNSSLCNNKLIGARSFNKGLIAKNVTISVNSARDTDGHGTHTSSTAAGNFANGASYFGYALGTASGVAPKAHVAIYKCLWEEGAVTSDIIAAIDQAIIDGVDVLSISLGLDGVALFADPIALATFAAVDKNIFVSTSAGNQGPFIGSLHNGIPWVLTVAAGTMDRVFGAEIKLEDGVSISGNSLYPGSFPGTKIPIVFLNCSDLKELRNVGAKIVLCEDKDGSMLSDQVNNIQTANVTGGVFSIGITDIEFLIQTPFPAVFITLEQGEAIKEYISKTKISEASITFRKTYLGTKQEPKVTSYSSRGPSPSCPFVLKPDVMAPGSLILASWPTNITATEANNQPLFSAFNLLSGTSMACPHAAGVGALLKKAHPEWSPAAIRSAMMTTGDILDNSHGPIRDMGSESHPPATPLAIGAGQVNPNKALDPGLIYDVTTTDYINLLCGLNFTDKQIRAITRSTSVDCSRPSKDLNYPSFIAFFNSNKTDTTTVEFERTVTNVGDAPSIYKATLTELSGLKVSVVPETLDFKAKNETQSYKLIIQGPGDTQLTETYGYLSWVDSKHVVKSPILVTNLRLESD